MKISKIISILLHPIFMPLLAIYITIQKVPSINFILNNSINTIYIVLTIFTIILPVVSIFLLIRSGKVKSLEMSDYKERSLPLFRTVIWMGFGLYLLNNIFIYTPILKAELIGAIIIIALAAIISKKWKISLHLLGAGGMVGILLFLQLTIGNIQNLLLFFILLSGILGVARLKQKAHNHLQIYTGFLLGVTIELFTLILLA